MSQCSIRNKNTGEPKLFYTSDKGETFTSLYEVLNNTTNCSSHHERQESL